MASNHTRFTSHGDQLRLAATIINRNPRCAGPSRCERHSLSEQFIHQRSVQHNAVGSYTNADCYSYRDADGNADPECYTDSHAYSLGNPNSYAKTNSHPEA
jgi:hypothetical protein